MSLKVCSSCKEAKSLLLFCKDRSRKDGLYPVCNSCRDVKNVKWRGSKYTCPVCGLSFGELFSISSHTMKRHNVKFYLKSKICKICNVETPIDFMSHGIRGGKCKKCYRIETRENQRKCRLDVLEHYGNKCNCCGENRKEFLAMDHINGGGHLQSKNIRRSLSRWILKNNFPDGFQILCHNCNLAKGFYGYCPHNVEKVKKLLDFSIVQN